jgi:hypothetical protein
MLSLYFDRPAASVRRHQEASRKARATVARALAALCEVCGGVLGGGAVLFGPTSYCSLECAHSARDRFVAGNYLG